MGDGIRAKMNTEEGEDYGGETSLHSQVKQQQPSDVVLKQVQQEENHRSGEVEELGL